jgi:hypothetical protein
MNKPYQVQVFGKAGCQKCAVLKQRLDKLLGSGEWTDFEQHYWDVETEEGLLPFCEAECVNPQRIPAMLVTRWDETAGEYTPIPNPLMEEPDPVCGKSRLFQHLGLQTDYTDAGKGVITPKMIKAVLKDAVA